VREVINPILFVRVVRLNKSSHHLMKN